MNFWMKFSHATVIRRIFDVLGKIEYINLALDPVISTNLLVLKVHLKVDFEGLDLIVEKLKDKPVYITIDLDVLDPSYFQEQNK